MNNDIFLRMAALENLAQRLDRMGEWREADEADQALRRTAQLLADPATLQQQALMRQIQELTMTVARLDNKVKNLEGTLGQMSAANAVQTQQAAQMQQQSAMYGAQAAPAAQEPTSVSKLQGAGWSVEAKPAAANAGDLSVNIATDNIL